MKNLIISTIIFLFTATVTSNAQFFRDSDPNNSGTTTGTSKNYSNNSEADDSSFGFFRSGPSDLNDRPGTGGGIGQEAPLGNGLIVMIVCCVLFGIVKMARIKNKLPFIASMFNNKSENKL